MRCVGVCAAPVFKIGICQRQQIFEHAFFRIALFGVIGHGRFGVLALRELSFAAVFLFHDRRNVRVFRHTEAADLEQLDVQRHRGDPFVAADDVRGAHKVVVHRVGEVVGWDAVLL